MKLRIARREGTYRRTHNVPVVFGRRVDASYTRVYWRVRWHIVDENGRCAPPGICGAEGQGACGWNRRREARARLAELDA